ncbi:aminotransferase class V-fold PLP-dependent enzyme [Bacteroidales bacterium OttesenSCG-928-B11]|nr:aminotransferase class V-fold PLP-dependent enzyme [Bacteroidales bacterium OttesenSCG-928-B11]MDL2325789.1 aminotransferase class V-fold PLP-dependent enzyme [Bacteroidales bacterium OttesenSCG-928-A14]
MRSFGSDNNSGVHPSILAAISKANQDHAIAYGDDLWTTKAIALIRDHFGKNAEPFFVFNGTGANSIAVQATTRSFQSVLAAETSHIAVDECGAPVFMSGASLQTIATPDGKLTPELVRPHLKGWGFEHHSQPKTIYISQCSELGTIYTVQEIRNLADLAHAHDMYLHVDGARLANAVVSANSSFKEMITETGVDILSFGGTKNGMLMGEAVISFRKELSENLKYIRKQSAQLASKMRYTSAQFVAYLQDDLWKNNAAHANRMAKLLRETIVNFPDIQFTQQTDANILLLKMPEKAIVKLLENHFFYIWDETQHEIRLVTSWDTAEDDFRGLIEDLRKACMYD